MRIGPPPPKQAKNRRRALRTIDEQLFPEILSYSTFTDQQDAAHVCRSVAGPATFRGFMGSVFGQFLSISWDLTCPKNTQEHALHATCQHAEYLPIQLSYVPSVPYPRKRKKKKMCIAKGKIPIEKLSGKKLYIELALFPRLYELPCTWKYLWKLPTRKLAGKLVVDKLRRKIERKIWTKKEDGKSWCASVGASVCHQRPATPKHVCLGKNTSVGHVRAQLQWLWFFGWVFFFRRLHCQRPEHRQENKSSDKNRTEKSNGESWASSFLSCGNLIKKLVPSVRGLTETLCSYRCLFLSPSFHKDMVCRIMDIYTRALRPLWKLSVEKLSRKSSLQRVQTHCQKVRRKTFCRKAEPN